ncbi:MAG: protein-ADP-ribose hydrolase [Treponema sp.]|jgi:O-acetyl-ADP-ribose deacetylase (regulator of RNase III)|nr:protein-ADP-ribose hydrolase [Treponema sp.]
MTKADQLDFLINVLSPLEALPQTIEDKWLLFRSLVNVRPPQKIRDEFLSVQDDLLKSLTAEKGITAIDNLKPIKDSIYLWRGDITTLKVDAIVNAANSALLGCFLPCHACIDNTIHTFAGVQLRMECAEIMERQGHPEPTGNAKITAAYNLPCKYVLHTVGPIISGTVSDEDRRLLASCYRSCLELSAQNGVSSIAFCCISTGEFRFPKENAAKIAIQTVLDFLKTENNRRNMKIAFNVFNEHDEQIYRRQLT